MGPKYDDIYTNKEVEERLPKEYYFKTYREALYGLSDVAISLRKDKFAQKDVTVFIAEDNLDGLEKLNFRRPRKQELLRKRYVDEDEWNLALLQFNEENRIYYEFKEQTRSRGNHSAGKCLLNLEITNPNELGARECIVNIRTSIVPYNLFYDLNLIHELIQEAVKTCDFNGVSRIRLNIGLFTIKKGASFGGLICMGYHFKDLRQSKFFANDVDNMFDNIRHPSTFKAARIGWDNAYYEMIDRLQKGESRDLWKWKPTRVIKHRKKEIIEGTKDQWGNGGVNPELVKLADELAGPELLDERDLERD